MTDQFEQETKKLIGVAIGKTPVKDHGMWVATADNRAWKQQDGRWKSSDGIDLPEVEMREMVVEQLEHYGITNDQINYWSH